MKLNEILHYLSHKARRRLLVNYVTIHRSARELRATARYLLLVCETDVCVPTHGHNQTPFQEEEYLHFDQLVIVEFDLYNIQDS
jgi:hypothetical protein